MAKPETEYGRYVLVKACGDCDFYVTPVDPRARYCSVCPDCGGELSPGVGRAVFENKPKRYFFGLLSKTEKVIVGFERKQNG